MIALDYRSIEPGKGHEAGRALLAELYSRHIGGAMPEIVKGFRGKPGFAGNKVYFSISHTKNHVFCALSERPVGIDAEELDRQVTLKLADKILSPMERAQFDTAEDPRRALLTFWVLKEAHAKRTGEGIVGYPNHTAFSLRDAAVSVVDGCLLAISEEETKENVHAV